MDGLDHIYKVTDKDGTSSYQQYVRNEDGSYAYVPVNENGVPLDDGADATTIDTTHYVHKSGNVYGLYNDNGVLTGYRERVKDGEKQKKITQIRVTYRQIPVTEPKIQEITVLS